MQLRRHLTSSDPVEPKELLAALEFSGNSFTFEIRDRAKYTEKYPEIDRIRLKLPNSADVRDTGYIREDSIEDIMKQLRVIKGVVNNLRLQGHTIYLKAIGTAALRDALNGPEIEERIFNLTGIQFEKIHGEDEAELCAKGITYFYPDITGLVVDMGGGSTEFALLRDGQIRGKKSLGFGTSTIITRDKPKRFVTELIRSLPPQFTKADRVLLSGGTLRNINNAMALEQGIDIKSGELKTCSMDDYKAFIKMLSKLDDNGWEQQPKNLQQRREFIPAAKHLVAALAEMVPNAQEVAITKTKTRDGLYRSMHEELLAQELEYYNRVGRHLESASIFASGIGLR